MSREKENYKSLLDKARVVANAASSSDAGSQRLGSKGRSSKGRSRFIDENDEGQLGASLIPRRGEESSVIEEGSITKLFNKVFASNQSTKELVRQYQDGSTSAMTDPKGKPLDILNKGDDVSIEIDPKSKEGINSFISSMAMSESSNNSRSIRTNKDGKEFGGSLNMGQAVQDQYMIATGAEFGMDDFRDDPILQKEVALFHIGKLDQAISSIKNIPEKFNNINGLRAVGHLGGATGMKKFVESNGKYNPKDELGTSLMDYFNKFSKKGV